MWFMSVYMIIKRTKTPKQTNEPTNKEIFTFDNWMIIKPISPSCPQQDPFNIPEMQWQFYIKKRKYQKYELYNIM